MATVQSLAALVGGAVVGDGSHTIVDVADLASAGPGHLSFLANPKYVDLAKTTQASAILVKEMVPEALATQIICQDPYFALATIATHLHPAPSYAAGIEAGAHVSSEATLHPTATVRVGAVVEAFAEVGANAVIGAGSYVGPRAKIGQSTLLHPGVRVLERCEVGSHCILHSGVVLGSDGFGYAPDAQGKRHKIPQVGIVVLEDDVEIGANTTVDRATFGTTRVGRGTKIDNLVQIAHNVVLGEHCVIVSQTGIAGSTKLGKRVIVGAQGGIVGHITIEDDVMLGARAGVASSIAERGIYSGTPIVPHRQWLKQSVAIKSLPELLKRVQKLENALDKALSVLGTLKKD